MVDEAALGDLDVEELPDAGWSEDALRGAADAAGVDEPAGADAVFEGQQLGLGAGDELGGAQRVAVVAFGAGDDDGAAPVGQGDVAGGAVGGGHGLPHRVGGDRRGERFSAGRVAVQAGGDQVVEAVTGDDVDVVGRDQAPVGDDTDPPDPEPVLQVVEHPGQGGDVGGVAGEHVMGDGDPVGGAQQADHHLRPIRAVITGVAERLGREPCRGPRGAFEVGRRQVVADQPQIQIGEVGQRRVQLRLGRRFDVGDDIDGPVVLVQHRCHEPGRHHHIGRRPTPAAAVSSMDRSAGWRPSPTPRQPPRSAPRSAPTRAKCTSKRSRRHIAATAAVAPTDRAASADNTRHRPRRRRVSPCRVRGAAAGRRRSGPAGRWPATPTPHRDATRCGARCDHRRAPLPPTTGTRTSCRPACGVSSSRTHR